MRKNGQGGKERAAAQDAAIHVRVTPELLERVERVRQAYQLAAPPGARIKTSDAARALLLEGVARFEEAERRRVKASGAPVPADCSAE